MDETPKTSPKTPPRKRRAPTPTPQAIVEAMLDLRMQDAVVALLVKESPRAAKLLKEALTEAGA